MTEQTETTTIHAVRPRPQLGECRNIRARLHRRRRGEVRETPRRYYAHLHGWERQETEPTKAVFIGWRTIANGESQYIGDEEGYAWYPSETFEAWLFVDDARRRPFYVLPEDAS